MEKNSPECFIGGGSFAEVYELVGHVPPAVVKYVNGGSREAIERYRKECDILKALRHPNITVLFGTREVPNSTRLGIIMEYCSGGPLKPAILNKKLIYTMKTVAVWAQQLFGALEYMYREHKVVHRDIKPDNIFITSEYSLKIGSFGLTKIAEQTHSSSNSGTERYMSPEIENRVSHQNDVYSLGLVLWELCERKVVLEEYGKEGKFNRIKFMLDVLDKKIVEIKRIAGPLEQIVEKCTNFNLSLRPMASMILQDLKEIEEKHPSLSNLNFRPVYNDKQLELVKPIFTDPSLVVLEEDVRVDQVAELDFSALDGALQERARQDATFTCPGSDDLLVDVTHFFSEYLLIKKAEIYENKLVLHLKNQDPAKTILTLEIWKLEQFKGTFHFRHFLGAEGATVIEISYIPNESNTNADTNQWIPDDLVGCVEMNLRVAPQQSDDGWQESVPMKKHTKYSCLRLERNPKSGRLIPSFFDHRLMIGGHELLDDSDEIPIPDNLSKLIKKASFDQTLATFQLHNEDLSEMTVVFRYLSMRNAGIRYLFPNWERPKIDPTKKAFIMKHQEDALVHISLRSPRTQKRLGEMKDTGSEILLNIKLEGSEKTSFFWFHLFFNKDSNKWKASLTTTQPAGDWPVSSTWKKRDLYRYRIN